MKELCETYQTKTNFLQYNGLVAKLKEYAKHLKINDWKTKLPLPLQPTAIKTLTRRSRGCSDFYNILNMNKDKPTSISKWNNVYEIDETTWSLIYKTPFQIECNTSLQWFQFKINHRILPTRKYLFHIKVSDSPTCLSCNETETIQHLLWECPDTQYFIKTIQTWIN